VHQLSVLAASCASYRIGRSISQPRRRSHAGATADAAAATAAATTAAAGPPADSGHQCDIEDERDSAAVDCRYVGACLLVPRLLEIRFRAASFSTPF